MNRRWLDNENLCEIASSCSFYFSTNLALPLVSRPSLCRQCRCLPVLRWTFPPFLADGLCRRSPLCCLPFLQRRRTTSIVIAVSTQPHKPFSLLSQSSALRSRIHS